MENQFHMEPLPRNYSMRPQHHPLDGYGHVQQHVPYAPIMQWMPPHPSQIRPYDNNHVMHHPGYIPQYPGNHMDYGGQISMISPCFIVPQSNLESVYQGVQAKIGTGIIDDPLEVFNRIMRENDKIKAERLRISEHRHSRSIENRSPSLDKIRRMKSRLTRVRSRDRSRNKDKRRYNREKRRHPFTSFSARSSRSRSRSHSTGRLKDSTAQHGMDNRSPSTSVSPK